MPCDTKKKTIDSIDVNGVIGEEVNIHYIGYLLSESKGDEIQVNITSPGGELSAALGIYNSLRESGKRVITAAQGVVASAGTVILLAGDEIRAAGNAVLVFHMPRVRSDKPMGVEELRKTAEDLETHEASIISIIKDRTGWTEDKCREFLNKEEALTPEEAKKMGLIDSILPFMRKKVDVSNMGMPDKIVAFVDSSNKELDAMALKDVCAKLELKVEDNATEEQIQDVIVNTITGLRGQITTLTAEKKELEEKVPKSKAKLSKTVLNLLTKNRTFEVDSLVTAGKIVPAVGNELLTVFTSEEFLNEHVDEEGEVVDEFDKTIEALRKNETVINFGGQSGTQVIQKSAERNFLLEDAERRAEAAKK